MKSERSSAEYRYLKLDESYVLHRGDTPIGKRLNAVALAVSLDSVDGLITLHKHGDPEMVQKWVTETKQKLLGQGAIGAEMVDQLKVIQGEFDLALLNDALAGVNSALKTLIQPDQIIDVQARVIPG